MYTPPIKHELHSSYSNALKREWQEDATKITSSNLMYPIFIVDGINQKQDILALPGQSRWSIDRLPELLDPLVKKGLKSILLFGVPQHLIKDAIGSSATSSTQPVVQSAIELIRKKYGENIIIACDLCLCAYTDHGHCGILQANGLIDNQRSIDRLAEIGLSYAKAGADIIAPSDMMDGRIGAIKHILAKNNLKHVSVMSYAIKFASCFYGPFRDAAASAPASGDRKKYQLPPGGNGLALRALERDIEEGADFVMVKPGMPYLDLVRQAKDSCNVPIAIYHVSGEYAMLYHAASKGAFDLRAAVTEALTCFRRAGATIIITYFTPDILDWLSSSSSKL